MYDHQINKMVDCLVTSDLVAEEKVTIVHQVLSQYWTGKIALVWQTDDVRSVVANKLGVELEEVLVSGLEADEILQSVLENHDCNIGVTWDNITWAIEETLLSSFVLKSDVSE